MLYLEDKREARLLKITETEGIEVEQALKIMDALVSINVHIVD